MILFFLIPWDGNIHREKQVNGYIVKAPVCANALIIVDDAQTFLIVFQVVDKGGCGQWLFQVIQTPAFIDFIEIRGFALGTLPNFKVTLGFEKAQDRKPRILLPCSIASFRFAAVRSLMVN